MLLFVKTGGVRRCHSHKHCILSVMRRKASFFFLFFRPYEIIRIRRAAREVGIASATGKNCASVMKPSVIASPNEEKITDSQSTIREAVHSGFKTAAISGAIAAVPTLVGCRVIPWAKANLNYTAQALIISAASIAGFFITADRTILQNARGNTIGKYDKTT